MDIECQMSNVKCLNVPLNRTNTTVLPLTMMQQFYAWRMSDVKCQISGVEFQMLNVRCQVLHNLLRRLSGTRPAWTMSKKAPTPINRQKNSEPIANEIIGDKRRYLEKEEKCFYFLEVKNGREP